jgi:MATE family multidrug resistance protein
MDDDAQNQQTDEEGFDGYVENTVDPGPWLLLGTTVFCFGVMLIIVPLMVAFKLRQRSRQAEHDINKEEQLIMEEQTKETVDTGAWSILSFNKETRKILKLAIPYTVSALASSTFSNICLVMVSQYIGTKAVAAYALVQILVGLTDGVLYGPIYSCTTLCAHAVGAGNTELAGQYIQLAMFFYLLFNIPIVYLWWFYMYEVILFLEWGDEATAEMAQDFIRVYIWSYILGGISSSVWQLLEVADHAVEGTVISILWGATNAALISALVTTREANLQEVGFLYILTAVMFIGLTFALAYCRGWLRPFTKGLFGTFALKNGSAIAMLLKQAVPLSFGSLLSNAEWAVLTFFASHLGPAEVAAWAILGSIWDVFYSVTSGIGDAAEIRVAYHLGDNHPTMAKLSAYKSLLLGMLVATVISIIYFSLQDRIPVWFTSDETLQSMLAELVPFVGVANLTMTFGMQCWSLIGAQGKYKLATWISFVSSWGICMPLSALYVFVFRIDLQGLTSAVVLGYVTTGAVLSFTLLSTDWYKVARKIQDQNSDTATGKDKSEEDGEEELYASLKYNSQAAKAAARRNIRLVTVPAGCKSGIILGNFYSRPGTYVLMVQHWSPLYGRVKPGDSILAIDGVNVSQESAIDISARLKTALFLDRQLAVTTPPGEMEDEYQDLLLQTVAEDESSEAPPTNSFSAQVF